MNLNMIFKCQKFSIGLEMVNMEYDTFSRVFTLLKLLLPLKVKVKHSRNRPSEAQRGSRKSRLLDFLTTAQYGGRLSALRTGRLYPQ